jgi:hypothetical protein
VFQLLISLCLNAEKPPGLPDDPLPVLTALPKLLDDALNIHLRGHFPVPVREFYSQEMVCEQRIRVGELGFQRELVRFVMEL